MGVETVINMPGVLERQARRIVAALDKDAKLRPEWIENQLEMADALATARQHFSENGKFGEWCRANDFGDNVLSADTRAALIQLGGDLPRARTMLETTDRWSIETIYRNEWRPRNAPKTAVPPDAPKRQAARVYVQAYEADLGKLPPETDIARATGVSRGTAADVLRDIKSRRSEADSAIRPLSKTTLAHIEAVIARRDRERQASFNETVRLQVLKENAPYRALLEESKREADKREGTYNSLINSYKPIFTDTEFTIILTCLHPDNSASPEKRDTAFKAFNAMKFQLTGKK